MKVLLWIVQILLACLFLFAGGMKLVLPIEQMTTGSPIILPGWLLRFLGVVEVLGALGLPTSALRRPIVTTASVCSREHAPRHALMRGTADRWNVVRRCSPGAPRRHSRR